MKKNLLPTFQAFATLARWIQARSYKKITLAALTTAAAAVAFYTGVVYPMTHQPVGADLCGGTGGTGVTVVVYDGKNPTAVLRCQ